MIRVDKCAVGPESLSSTNRYDGEDVKKQLLNDQKGKCYLCERYLETDFTIEHIKSRANYPDLVRDWNNLLLCCSYCNERKSDSFDDILSPVNSNIEELIEQRLDFLEKKAIFVPTDKNHSDSISVKQTINLLEKLYNNVPRKIKEERFFEYALSEINLFSDIVLKFLKDNSEENIRLLKSNLSIDRELLGFKYWIIKDNAMLYSLFNEDIIWKTQ